LAETLQMKGASGLPISPLIPLDSVPLLAGVMPGGQWGDFELMEEIGRGGMGVVFRARQISLNREVALKLMLSVGVEFRHRFQREARALAQVDSQHVVKVHFSGVEAGHPYIVMEYLVGTDLGKKLKGGWRPTPDEALDLVLQAARGLSAAGELGIVHRDIKPANLMITERNVLKLMDFGLVRMAQETELTNSGAVIGTVNYFSPEQAHGQRCDQRSDVYSLGVVFYELLCGHALFPPGDAATLMFHHAYIPPEPMRRWQPNVPAGHEAIAMRCLLKDPDKRYQSAAELVADLERLQRGQFHVRGERVLAKRIGAGIALAALIGLGIYSFLPDRPELDVSTTLVDTAPLKPTAPVVEAGAGAAISPPPEAISKPPLAAPSTPAGEKPVSAPPDDPASSSDMPVRASGLGDVQRDEYGYYADLTVATQTLRFRWCKGGTFSMGSSADEYGRENDETLHQVTLTRGFWMADRECTQALWQAVLTKNPSKVIGAQFPVHNLSRVDCLDFCRELARMIPGHSSRPPWEAEWEYACRAGTNNASGSGLIDGTTACMDTTAPKPVGSYPPNQWRLYDMIGNVGEWCLDGYAAYPTTAVTDPKPENSAYGVSRGGFWEDIAGTCRVAKRFKNWIDRPNRSLGLRLVVDAAPTQTPE
jgi:formylglycine-generating enzyme required for sulfatase activity/predicted Ser/Thr protein kinase